MLNNASRHNSSAPNSEESSSFKMNISSNDNASSMQENTQFTACFPGDEFIDAPTKAIARNDVSKNVIGYAEENKNKDS